MSMTSSAVSSVRQPPTAPRRRWTDSPVDRCIRSNSVSVAILSMSTSSQGSSRKLNSRVISRCGSAFSASKRNTCHRPDSLARGPNLEGLFGKTVALQGGGRVVADENYIRESIVAPNAKIVEGFQPIMPTFQGLVTEEQLMQLIAYIRSLPEAKPGS